MVVRRIRVSFSDPDATDSDSDSGDDASFSSCQRGRKAAVESQFVILVGRTRVLTSGASRTACPKNGDPSRSSKMIQAAAGPSSSPRMRSVKAARSSAPKRRFRGVYERQPGRWAAEFRDHRLKVRRWVGTFPSEEEAKAAYDAFEMRFRSAVGLPPSPTALDQRGGNVHGIDLVSHQQDRKKDMAGLKQPEALTTVTMESRARVASVSSASCVSSLTTTSATAAAAATYQNPLQHAEERGMLDPFLAEDLADEDLIGLADLGHLPLPSLLDDNLDFDLTDLSLFNIGFI